MRKAVHILSNLLVTAIVLTAVIFMGMQIFGFRTFTVLSGSMEPAVSTGSLLYVQPVDYRTLKTGDIITFRQGENITVTHRIVSVHKENGDTWFQTKGDANNVMDGSPVHRSQVIGRLFCSIPAAGFIVHYLQNLPVSYLAAVLGACGMFFLLLPDFLPKKKVKQRKGRYLRQ